jgi:hypothetical protein
MKPSVHGRTLGFERREVQIDDGGAGKCAVLHNGDRLLAEGVQRGMQRGRPLRQVGVENEIDEAFFELIVPPR